MKLKPCMLALLISASAWNSLPAYAQSTEQVNTASSAHFITLSQLIEVALNHDAQRQQFYAQAQATREMGIASATLMDPKLRMGVTGLPVDNFALDQDPMTNLSIGLMQQFERGNTLNLQQEKASQQADGIELQIAAREREVINRLTQLWLELGYQQHAERLLLANQKLMKELEGVIRTNYSIGKNEAQDLLNAQLLVSQLDEKQQANQQIQQRIVSQMSEWLGSEWLLKSAAFQATNQLDWQVLDQQLSTVSSHQYFSLLAQHPMVRIAEANIAVSQTQVKLAEQSYAPQFGIEVMYAYRQANNMKGEPASDLISAYLTMDIPLFTGNRQDRSHAAAQYQVGAAQSQKDLLLMQMNAQVNALLVDKTSLEQRLTHYQTMLKQARSRTRAVERGYQNSTAQFNDVISATRDELALELEQQRLLTDLNQTKSQLAMLLGGFRYTVGKPTLPTIHTHRF
ncbi:heavy metal RND efflux outer membrane protein [Vibrio cincinnatiensis]|uniref:Outer membrane protein TolC n=1 Tax=Vibrio cincinnatiensis DSM 19608 TaxID=1123491 RepID=A0A1T4L2U4_VIBCI|nr:TolC family protein [Vibrio cincinnatiensis]SJZ49034.1 Outer membrane protein TolC [Vibrio cincinnatiensis DSM 19608]SUP48242.1 heavy metal RND efflux outer membrane protein [Vibrio cincinnatiensis]